MRTQFGRWEYEITDDNVVEAWYLDSLNSDVEGCPPNIRQPHHPNGEPFENAESARIWIEAHITMFDEMVANPPVIEEPTPEPIQPVE